MGGRVDPGGANDDQYPPVPAYRHPPRMSRPAVTPSMMDGPVLAALRGQMEPMRVPQPAQSPGFLAALLRLLRGGG